MQTETKKLKIAMYKSLRTPESNPLVTIVSTWLEEPGSGYIRISDIIEIELTMLPKGRQAEELASRLENARVTKEKADRAYYELEKQVCG